MYLFTLDIERIRELIEDNQFQAVLDELLKSYESLGPLPGILLPFLEAFLSFLPLVVFVAANGAAYGLLKGFLYSWIGACAGSILVFLIVRKLGNKRFFQWLKRNRQIMRVTDWLDRHGFGPLFLLMCFPFSPSSIINIVAGLSHISIQQFVLAVLMGKTVMIFTIAFVGDSIASFAQNPVKTVVVGIGIFVFWLLGKVLEKRLQKRSGREQPKSKQD